MTAGKWTGVFNSMATICTNPKNAIIRPKRFIGLLVLFVIISIVEAIGIGSIIAGTTITRTTRYERIEMDRNDLELGELAEE